MTGRAKRNKVTNKSKFNSINKAKWLFFYTGYRASNEVTSLCKEISKRSSK